MALKLEWSELAEALTEVARLEMELKESREGISVCSRI